MKTRDMKDSETKAVTGNAKADQGCRGRVELRGDFTILADATHGELETVVGESKAIMLPANEVATTCRTLRRASSIHGAPR